MSEYQATKAEHMSLVRYLRLAVGVLSKAECQLLLEFADLSKQKCERLRRTLRARPHARRTRASRSMRAARL